jgi:hypothetical protein
MYRIIRAASQYESKKKNQFNGFKEGIISIKDGFILRLSFSFFFSFGVHRRIKKFKCFVRNVVHYCSSVMSFFGRLD